MRRRKEAKTLQYMYLFSYFVFFHHGDKLWDDIFFTFYQVTWLISFTTFIVQYHIIQDTTLNNSTKTKVLFDAGMWPTQCCTRCPHMVVIGHKNPSVSADRQAESHACEHAI